MPGCSWGHWGFLKTSPGCCVTRASPNPILAPPLPSIRHFLNNLEWGIKIFCCNIRRHQQGPGPFCGAPCQDPVQPAALQRLGGLPTTLPHAATRQAARITDATCIQRACMAPPCGTCTPHACTRQWQTVQLQAALCRRAVHVMARLHARTPQRTRRRCRLHAYI